jgi:hypothetical protein
VRGGGGRGIDLRIRLRGWMTRWILQRIFLERREDVAALWGAWGLDQKELGPARRKKAAGTDAGGMGRDVSVWSGLFLGCEFGSVSMIL